MTRKPRILAFAGSLREHSYNKQVVQAALRGAEDSGAEVTLVDLRDYSMPIYNSDDEDKTGLPENAVRFQELLARHDGFLIASPEYNGSISGALKNVIDWASRQSGPIKRSETFAGKFAAIMTAGPGSFGGIRALSHLRGVLISVGVNVLSSEIAVSFAADKFDAAGQVMDEKTKVSLENLGESLVQTLKKINGVELAACA